MMLALLSVWIGLVAMAAAVAMIVYRPLFHDVTIPITLYSAIVSMTLAGITLWALRKRSSDEEDVGPARLQCYVGVGCSLVAVVIVYALVQLAERVPTGS